MSDPVPIYWTVAARFRGEPMRALVDTEAPRPAEMPVFGQDAPPPAAKEHGLRHKAVGAAIQALLGGAEAVEIFRFPPFSQQPQPQPKDHAEL